MVADFRIQMAPFDVGQVSVDRSTPTNGKWYERLRRFSAQDGKRRSRAIAKYLRELVICSDVR